MNFFARIVRCAAMLALLAGLVPAQAAPHVARHAPKHAAKHAPKHAAKHGARHSIHHAPKQGPHHPSKASAKAASHRPEKPGSRHASAFVSRQAALRFAPPGAGSVDKDNNTDDIQRWPAQVVIGATVTAFSPQGDVGSVHAIDNGHRAQVRFHGGSEVNCQVMLVPHDREIPPGSTGSALLTCQTPFRVLKDEPTFTLHEGGRLVGEGNLSVLAEQ